MFSLRWLKTPSLPVLSPFILSLPLNIISSSVPRIHFLLFPAFMHSSFPFAGTRASALRSLKELFRVMRKYGGALSPLNVPVAELTILLNIAAAVKVAGSGDPPPPGWSGGAGPPPRKQTRLPPLPHSSLQILKNSFDDFSGGKTFCNTIHSASNSGGACPV